MQTATHLDRSRQQRGEAIQRIRHYRHLVWRSKWYLLISGAVITCICLAALIVFINRRHDESTTAIIGVENTADLTAIKDVSGLMQAQSDLILSRTFLKDIVRSLSLQLAVRKFDRGSIFDSVLVDSQAIAGDYRFAIDKKNKDSFVVYFAKESGSGLSLEDIIPLAAGIAPTNQPSPATPELSAEEIWQNVVSQPTKA